MSDQPIMLSDEDVAAAFDLDTAIASQRRAFEALGAGEATLAEKVAVPNADDSSVALGYLARLSPKHGAVCKLVDVHPDNPDRGLPSVHGTVLVLDARTGQLSAIMDARTLTELRTAAASAVAADLLAPPEVDELAVLGCGVQGKAHVRAIARVRPLRRVRMWSPSPARRHAAAEALAAELGLEVLATDSVAGALRGAPLVAVCTLSTTPVFSADHLATGTTVLCVGSFEPHRRELPPELMRAATVVVDDTATALEHAGPVLHAVRSGELAASDIVALGAVLTGDAEGRTESTQLVVYVSVGIGVQDAAAAHAVLDRRSAGMG
jgi:ornithine cyclodeaminase/alanine dehydrogenase-like protein (mu-crystallin family)